MMLAVAVISNGRAYLFFISFSLSLSLSLSVSPVLLMISSHDIVIECGVHVVWDSWLVKPRA